MTIELEKQKINIDKVYQWLADVLWYYIQRIHNRLQHFFPIVYPIYFAHSKNFRLKILLILILFNPTNKVTKLAANELRNKFYLGDWIMASGPFITRRTRRHIIL